MKRYGRRLFDAALIGSGFVLIVVVLNLVVLHGATPLTLATILLVWLMCSLPVAVLIGHCALSEE